jgi:hypothetical protein
MPAVSVDRTGDIRKKAKKIFQIETVCHSVTGTQAVRFLRNARTKSKALQEVIAGNELFKQQNAESAAAFKQAHNNQSPETRQLVTQMKTAS